MFLMGVLGNGRKCMYKLSPQIEPCCLTCLERYFFFFFFFDAISK